MSSEVTDEVPADVPAQVPAQFEIPAPNVRGLRMNQRIRQMLLGVFLLDAGVLFVMSVLAWDWRNEIDKYWASQPYDFSWAPLLGPGLIVVWLVSLVVMGAYRTRNYGAGFEEFRSIIVASAIAFGIACMGGFLSYNQPTRGYPLIFFFVGTPMLLLVRYIDRLTLHSARAQGRLTNRVIAVGSPMAIQELVEVLNRAPWMGYRLVGMCVPGGHDPLDVGLPVFGDIDDVRQVAINSGADGVIVAGGSYSSAADLRRLGWALQGLDLDMLVIPSLTDIAGPRVHMRHVAGLPFVQVEEPQSDRAGGWVKRFFDLIVGSAVVVFLSPLLVATAVIIWAQDRGPVFYRQTRVGIHGEEFQMVKFRSMIVNAEALRASLDEHNEVDGVLFKMANDPRITRFGRFIRKYSIDELPQLINVLRGEMSLVGPRPLLPTDVVRYEKDTHRRALVRPGMTGLWQVSGRSDLSWAESVRLDLYYVDNWSMVIDLVIMVKTVKAVLVSEGAY
ncbi:MAG: Exopolysaccharide biosynthesis polyprenyl glycosylphosphotransferase [Marmoricola sp.]|nr:Exopolysaccharide biosynthesis polyprenyl glycosylphosphotransferase [Marmoricola sp.]